MKRFLLAAAICLVLLTGCNTRKQYHGKCTIEKVDGVVTRVKVYWPERAGQREADFTLENKEDLDKLIFGLDSVLQDLKLARDQMKNVEPPPK